MLARWMINNTRYSRIENDLRNRIINGKLPEGEALPGEIALSSAYGVSRKTMRKALENLRTQNYIRKRKGQGNFVIPASERSRMERVTGKIHLLLPEGRIAGNFVGEIAAGVNKFALEEGLEITIGSHDETGTALQEMYHNFLADAFIWCALSEMLPPAITSLSKSRIPQVVVDSHVQGTGSVSYDSLPAWRTLFNLLAAAGHRSVAFIERSGVQEWALARQSAFRMAADEYKMNRDIFKTDASLDAPLAEFILGHPQITAYVVITPLLEMFLMTVKTLGEKIPELPSWVEFTPDGITPAARATRIYIPTQEMGFEAARLVARHNFRTDPAPSIRVPCFTVAGLTTGAAPRNKQSGYLPDD